MLREHRNDTSLSFPGQTEVFSLGYPPAADPQGWGGWRHLRVALTPGKAPQQQPRLCIASWEFFGHLKEEGGS